MLASLKTSREEQTFGDQLYKNLGLFPFHQRWMEAFLGFLSLPAQKTTPWRLDQKVLEVSLELLDAYFNCSPIDTWKNSIEPSASQVPFLSLKRCFLYLLL